MQMHTVTDKAERKMDGMLRWVLHKRGKPKGQYIYEKLFNQTSGGGADFEIQLKYNFTCTSLVKFSTSDDFKY